MNGTVKIDLHGESLLLHPHRAVIWPRQAAAIVADTHFGKSSVFGRNGIAVPAGTDEADQRRLTQLMQAHAVRRLVVLGDFLHAPIDAQSPEADSLERWSRAFAGVHIQVIAGNHDRGVTGGWRGPIEWIARECIEPPFRFVHDGTQRSVSTGESFCFSGHIHPVFALRGLRKRFTRIPVFWLRAHEMVLPSFGSFTGGHRITPARGEQLFAVGPDQVTAFPPR